ncbi:hypothetical protein VKT23_004606 [Stygiomarasmius scandens]|uniref:Uncharacterized protein n=1 Tax=Marasmiellus scandens TaxID=2682957 RepID=A0ABR1JZ36_9AGAR
MQVDSSSSSPLLPQFFSTLLSTSWFHSPSSLQIALRSYLPSAFSSSGICTDNLRHDQRSKSDSRDFPGHSASSLHDPRLLDPGTLSFFDRGCQGSDADEEGYG